MRLLNASANSFHVTTMRMQGSGRREMIPRQPRQTSVTKRGKPSLPWLIGMELLLSVLCLPLMGLAKKSGRAKTKADLLHARTKAELKLSKGGNRWRLLIHFRYVHVSRWTCIA